MELNDYVNRLRHAMKISEAPRFSPGYIAQCCTYAENLLKQGLREQWLEPFHHGGEFTPV